MKNTHFFWPRAEGARKKLKIRKRLLRIFEPPKTWSKPPPYLRAKSTNRGGGFSTTIRPDYKSLKDSTVHVVNHKDLGIHCVQRWKEQTSRKEVRRFFVCMCKEGDHRPPPLGWEWTRPDGSVTQQPPVRYARSTCWSSTHSSSTFEELQAIHERNRVDSH